MKRYFYSSSLKVEDFNKFKMRVGQEPFKN